MVYLVSLGQANVIYLLRQERDIECSEGAAGGRELFYAADVALGLKSFQGAEQARPADSGAAVEASDAFEELAEADGIAVLLEAVGVTENVEEGADFGEVESVDDSVVNEGIGHGKEVTEGKA
jgi:hypothetical protein